MGEGDAEDDSSTSGGGKDASVKKTTEVTAREKSPENSPALVVSKEEDNVSFPDAVTKVRRKESALHYKQIEDYLRDGTLPKNIPVSLESLIKKNALAYSLIDDVLYYGQRTPRKVIVDEEEQGRILQSFHLETKSLLQDGEGHVSSVKKMHRLISQFYYWRHCFADVTKYVAACKVCSVEKQKLEETKTRSTLVAVSEDHVWKKCELRVFGPYAKSETEKEYIAAVIDPRSRWLSGQAISGEQMAKSVANFLFDVFCNLGFAKSVVVVGFTEELYDEMLDLYEARMRRLSQLQEVSDFTLQDTSTVCSWLEDILERFVCRSSSSDWALDLSQFLYEFRTSPLVELDMKSPYDLLFCRPPQGRRFPSTSSPATERRVATTRRKLQSSTLECRHCQETFTSKISFRIHQRIHTEEAKKRGLQELQTSSSKGDDCGAGDNSIAKSSWSSTMPTFKNQRLSRRKQAGTSVAAIRAAATLLRKRQGMSFLPDDDQKKEVTARAAERVRALVSSRALSLRGKRAGERRGKYHKYSVEQRHEIAKYALQHGAQSAATHYTEKYGIPLSVSTVGNFVRLFKNFPPEVVEEIGWFAHQYGIDVASKHFTKKLGHDVKPQIARSFRRLFLRKNPNFDESSGASSSTQRKTRQSKARSSSQHPAPPAPPGGGGGPHLSLELRREIGAYALQYGAVGAAQHFSAKLQLHIRENFVRRCRRELQDQSQHQQHAQHQFFGGHPQQTHPQQQPTNPYPMHQQALHQQGAYDQQAYCHQVVELQPPSTNYGTDNSLAYLHQQPQQQYLQDMQHPQPSYHQQVLEPAPPTMTNYHLMQETPNNPTGAAMMGNNQSMVSYGEAQQQPYMSFEPAPMPHQPSAITSAAAILDPQPDALSTVPQKHGANDLNPFSDPMQELKPMVQSLISHHEQVTHHEQVSHHSIMTHDLRQSWYHQTTMDEAGGPSASGDTGNRRPAEEDEFQAPPASVRLDTPAPVVTAAGLEEERETEAAVVASTTAVAAANQSTTSASPANQKKPTKPNRRPGKRRIKRRSSNAPRGQYATYTPEFRAKVGQFAARFGVHKTLRHFVSEYGVELPESTIRGLRAAYLAQKNETKSGETVQQVEDLRRGRPVLLGKYDEVVMNVLSSLASSGTKLTPKIVIATSREVILQYEPSLLPEHGGSMELNTSFAKSVLKRFKRESAGATAPKENAATAAGANPPAEDLIDL